MFGILVENGRAIRDYQASSPCPSTLADGRENKLQGDAPWYVSNRGMLTLCEVLLPSKKQIIGSEFWPGAKLWRTYLGIKQPKKGQKEFCQLYGTVYRELHQHTSKLLH